MKEASQILAERHLLLLIEFFQIGGDHEHQRVRRYSPEVRHAEEGLIEDLLDDHYYGAQVLALKLQLLNVVNRVNAAVRLLGAVLMLEVLLRLLVYRDIYL